MTKQQQREGVNMLALSIFVGLIVSIGSSQPALASDDVTTTLAPDVESVPNAENKTATTPTEANADEIINAITSEPTPSSTSSNKWPITTQPPLRGAESSRKPSAGKWRKRPIKKRKQALKEAASSKNSTSPVGGRFIEAPIGLKTCGQSTVQEDDKRLPFYAGVLLELAIEPHKFPLVKLCSGVLIDWRTVLVAESCVTSFSLDEMNVTVSLNLRMSSNETETNEQHIPATICRNPYFVQRVNTLDDKIEFESDYLLVRMDWPIDYRSNCATPVCLADNTPETCKLANHLCRVMRLDYEYTDPSESEIDLEFYKSSFREKACRCRQGGEKMSFCLPRAAVKSIRPKKKLWTYGKGGDNFVIRSYRWEDHLGSLDSPFDQKGVIVCPCLANESNEIYWQAVATLSHSCSEHWFAVTPLSHWQEEIFKMLELCP